MPDPKKPDEQEGVAPEDTPGGEQAEQAPPDSGPAPESGGGMSETQIRAAGYAVDVPYDSGDGTPRLKYGAGIADKPYDGPLPGDSEQEAPGPPEEAPPAPVPPGQPAPPSPGPPPVKPPPKR